MKIKILDLKTGKELAIEKPLESLEDAETYCIELWQDNTPFGIFVKNEDDADFFDSPSSIVCYGNVYSI